MAKDHSDSSRSTKSPLIKSRQRPDTSTPTASAQLHQPKPSWSGASWRGKANAVAGIARDTTSAKPSLDNAPVADSSQRSTQPISQGLNTPSKSTPALASTTPLHATGNGKSPEKLVVAEKANKTDESQLRDLGPTTTESKPADTDGTGPDSTNERPTPASGWRGWWSRRDASAAEKPEDDGPSEVVKDTDEATLAALEGNTAEPKRPGHDSTTKNSNEESSEQAGDSRQSSRSSWFSLLGSMAPFQAAADQAPDQAANPPAPKGDLPAPAPSTYNATPEAPYQAKLPDRPSTGSWAFWMRDSGQKPASGKAPVDQKRDQVGELAVSGTDSQSKPQIASVGNTAVGDDASSIVSKKRERPVSDAPQGSVKRKSMASIISKESDSAKTDTSSDSEASPSMQESVLKTTVDQSQPREKKKATVIKQQANDNLVLPLFESMYPAARPSSYLSKLAWVIGRGHAEKARHLKVAQSSHHVKRGLAIGIHGLFPTPMLQKILGPPTGTSIRFADGAAEAIKKVTADRGYSCDVEKVALEGEGVISDRIDTLWKLLLNWIDQIRRADFIFVACHSQGVPVAVSLVARLLNFGCIQSSARIGICGMAGVNLGPFASYQSRFLQGSAAELFSLSQGTSPASQAYTSALSLVLSHNVRILYIGSIDDQLVSMESSTFTNVTHPYIYRAVFVDGRIHAPDFLTHLVGFSLKLRNLGINDHGLIRELSGPLAGSLYTGEGHSRIYEEQAVYELALRHALDTETLDTTANPSLDIKPYEVSNSTTANPYFLPWAMRGMLEEDFVQTELKSELVELLGMFERWRPQSKVLKDVKFRLEAVKSKL